MRSTPLISALFFLSLSSLTGARRGGDSSGGGGDSGGSGGGGGEGGGSGSNDPASYVYCNPADFNDISDSSTASCGLGTCECNHLLERRRLYGLPGLYYNGTITVRHQVSYNPAWSIGCNNNDEEPKTYRYPALLLVGPTGNSSDTNPIHWSLYGYEPADEAQGLGSLFVDTLQRWVFVRSSDFVVTGSGCRNFDSGIYARTDATEHHQLTRVYWQTNVTETGSSTFSANAVLTHMPPTIDELRTVHFDSYEDEHTHPSQYITLSDVCSFDTSNRSLPNTTTPTLWITKGATVDMKDIGLESMTLTLNNSINNSICFLSDRVPSCESSRGFEWGPFFAQADLDSARWNISVSITLEFEGTLVQENSTRINGSKDGKPEFNTVYMRTGNASDSGASASSLTGSSAWVVSSALLMMLFQML